MPSNVNNQVPHGVYLLQYNGFTFNPAVTITARHGSKAEWDTAKRTIKFMRTTLVIESYIFVSPTVGTTDTTMEALRQRLMSPGGALYYRDKGFGDFNINIGGPKKDAAWGPKPLDFNAEPVADSYCWKINWSVEVCIPWCDNARFENAIAAWNYQWYSDRDDGGYEGRRIQGTLEIPITRQQQADRFIRTTADDYREQIQPRCPPFFRPTQTYFNLSEDRRVLTFNFHFEQFPGPIPPPGILKVSLSSSNTNQAPSLFAWEWALNGSYELIQGVPHSVAWAHFQSVRDFLQKQIEKEVAAAKMAKAANKQNNGANNGGLAGQLIRAQREFAKDVILGAPIFQLGGIVKDEAKDAIGKEIPAKESDSLQILPVNFRATNPDYYGKPKCDFYINHRVAATTNTLLTAGLWEVLPGSDGWQQWYKSAERVFGARGYTGSHFDPGDDVIIDVCRGFDLTTLKGRRPAAVRKLANIPIAGATLGTIDPDKTWMELNVDLELLQKDAVMVHKPLPRDVTLRSRRGGGTSSLKTPALLGAMGKFVPPEDQDGKPGFAYGSGKTTDYLSTVIRQAASTYTVLVHGFGVRVGLPPTPFGLASIGGIPAVAANDPELGDGSRVTTIGNLGSPIYVGVWQFRYLLPAAAGTMPKDADSGAPAPVPNRGGGGGGGASGLSGLGSVLSGLGSVLSGSRPQPQPTTPTILGGSGGGSSSTLSGLRRW